MSIGNRNYYIISTEWLKIKNIFTFFIFLTDTTMRQILSAIFFFILSVKLTQGTANFTNATNASITTNSSSNSPNVTTNLTTLYIGAFFDLDSKSGYGRLPMAEQAIEEVNNNENILPGYRVELVPISTQVSGYIARTRKKSDGNLQIIGY